MTHSAQVDTLGKGFYSLGEVSKFRISCLCGHQTEWFASLSAAINAHADHIETEALALRDAEDD